MKSKSIIILIISLATYFSSCKKSSEPGLYINEFLASNGSINIDSLKFLHSDWIEIYNAYDSTIDLSGYFLTDNLDDSTKWVFPKGSTLAPDSLIIVWADKLDTALHSNFKLSKGGGQIAMYSKNMQLVDFVDYSPIPLDVSYGRKWDGVDDWVYFDEPSPGNSNLIAEGVEDPAFSAAPVFSLAPGFYSSMQTLLLSGSGDAEIRYTLDGSVPKRNSERYRSAITIDSTMVIRAIAIEDEKLSSDPITMTYFINVNKDLPVFSLVADSVALWDSVSGIYRNSLREIERMVNVEFFIDRNQVINQRVDMRLSGNWARHHWQKAMLLEPKEKYGKGTLDYRFFPQKQIYSFHSLLLRAGGHPDKYNTMFLDGMGEFLPQKYVDVDYSAYRPAVVYLNGKYWGMYNMREKESANYIVDNHNLDKGHFDMLKASWMIIKNGNSNGFRKSFKYITNCDNTAQNYKQIESLIDVDNYINYNIIQIYSANVDWPNWNIKFWRENAERGLWKWILADLDFGFGTGKPVDFDMIGFATSPVETRVTNPPHATALLRSLMKFPEFKKEFIQRFAVSLNVIYSSERVLKTINEFENERANEMPFEIERWKDSVYQSPSWGKFRIPYSMEVWDKKIERVRDFARKRPDFVRQNLIKKFDIDGLVDIKTISKGGHIVINTIKLDEGTLEGIYFKGIPMRLSAIPVPGQKFMYWEINGKKVNTPELNYHPVSAATIEAVFNKEKQTKLPCIISTNKTLTIAHSPYYATCDVVVEKGATLTIEKGVQILMEKHHSIIVYGGLDGTGTEKEPIIIMPDPNTKTTEWGALCVDNASDKVNLNYVNLKGGTWYDDKTKYKATFTAINSDIELNHVNIGSSHFPFYSEYGTVSIRNSRLTSSKTCDMINIKYATKALVEGCDLPGNDYPDTDAIDYDGISNGVIRNNRIYGFFGFNSDAIDIGEGSSGILIEGNTIMNMTDKGVSIGQGSDAIIRNNFIYGCAMGVGIKDKNSHAFIDQNTFYGTKYGVAVFEKNYKAGGGSAEIQNCIFAQSRKKPVFVDSLSQVKVSYSISEKKKLKGQGNIKADVGFENRQLFDFTLKKDSPARKAGDKNQDLGANVNLPTSKVPDIVFTEINYSPEGRRPSLVWIELYNNSEYDRDLTGWTIKNENHRTYSFPQNFILKKHQYIVITTDLHLFSYFFPEFFDVRDYLDLKLIDKGNALLLYNEKMNLVDYFDYKNILAWPPDPKKTGAAFKLKSPALDNSKAQNWKVGKYTKVTPGI